MKINNVNEPINFDRNAVKPADATASGKVKTAPAGSGETLSISNLSAQLSALEARLSEGDEFDTARIDAIKLAIREGQFKVNPEVVADRLIESAKEFLRK